MTWLAIFVGGGAGTLCRYFISHFVGERYSGVFPLGTAIINVSGCFAIGVVASIVVGSAAPSTVLTGLLVTGFLGGYTTFSTYALEGVILYADRSRLVAAFSLGAPVLLGLLGAAAGASLTHLAQAA